MASLPPLPIAVLAISCQTLKRQDPAKVLATCTPLSLREIQHLVRTTQVYAIESTLIILTNTVLIPPKFGLNNLFILWGMFIDQQSTVMSTPPIEAAKYCAA